MPLFCHARSGGLGCGIDEFDSPQVTHAFHARLQHDRPYEEVASFGDERASPRRQVRDLPILPSTRTSHRNAGPTPICMTLRQLLRFVELESARITERYGSPTIAERRLSRTVKLGEEYGELCNEIMFLNNEQRPEKVAGRSPTALDDEVADVLITTLLVADACGVDVVAALVRKIAKIEARYGPGGIAPH